MTASSMRDTRGLSESTGVAVLVLMAVLGTLSVGMTVFTVNEEDQGELGTTFNFQHQDNLQLLLIFYDDGEDLRAGSLYVDGPANNVTWAELTEVEADATVSPGGQPIRVGASNAYGSRVGEEAYFEILYTTDAGEQLVLGTYGEPSDDAGSGGPVGDGPDDGPGDGEP